MARTCNSTHCGFCLSVCCVRARRFAASTCKRSIGRARRARMSTDLFGAPTLIGLKLKLDRPIDRERPCCRNVCTIGAAREPHVGELTCSNCGQHRGWLSKSTAQWIGEVVARFGAPATPIVVRKAHTFEEEAPGTGAHALSSKLVTRCFPGAAPPSIIMRHGEMGMNYDNTNRGTLFRNDDKDPNNDKDRDYRGSLNIDGTEYWLSGYVRTSKKDGRKFLSLSVKAKQDKPVTTNKSRAEELGDSIAF